VGLWSFLLDIPLVRGIGWGVLHSLWVGTALAAGLYVVLALTRRRSPKVRYFLCCMGLAGAVALPAAMGVCAALNWRVEAPLLADAGFILEPAVPRIAIAWVVGASLALTQLVGGWAYIQHRMRRDAWPSNAVSRTELLVLSSRLGLAPRVRILESTYIETPLVVGALRPAVVLPTLGVLELSARELDAILGHELAHIRRHDYLANLVQSVVEAVLFYHPAVWWLSRLIRQEREHCCDDLAVRACGDTLLYLRSLTVLESLRYVSPAPVAAAAGTPLVDRIRRLAERRGRRPS